MVINRFVKGLIAFVAVVVVLLILYNVFGFKTISNKSGSYSYPGSQNPVLELRIQELERELNFHEQRLTSLDEYRFEFEGTDTDLVIKTNKLQSKVDNLEWLNEELKWEIFMLMDTWVIDRSSLCTGDQGNKNACLQQLTYVYRSFVSDDPQYCERIGDSDLKIVCLRDYDKADYGYWEWYNDYFLTLAYIPDPYIPLDKAGICDQDNLEITKTECLNMLTSVRNAIENNDVSYCNNIQEDATDMRNACTSGVDEFGNYGEWYDYYFLGFANNPFMPGPYNP